MASKDDKFTGYLDFHCHQQNPDTAHMKSIYAYNPGINSLPNQKSMFSCGLHPWQLENYNISNSLDQISRLAQEPHCLAIGETGLDRSIKYSLEDQITAFKVHISLSESLGKPLIIHCVRAYDLILSLYKQISPRQTWIIHDFNGNLEILEQCLKFNIFFSLGSRIFKPQQKVSKIFSKIPLSKIFLETDDQDEVKIDEIYAHASQIRGVSIKTLQEEIWKSYQQLLK